MDWFNVLDKKTSSNSDFLGWMERQQNISSSTATTGPFIPIMAAHHHQQSHPYPPFLGDDDGGGGSAGAGAVGPTNKSGGDSGAAVSIYRDQVPSHGGGGAGAENFVNNTTILQPFDYSSTHYKSPGGGMAARDYPFTGGQWKELERQAMIYKCMISSVPVSPHLLFPLDYTVTSRGGRYSRKVDVEVGRCKRTDGKKWRCSREVAPLQKYCDRHLHRGRPRSRKPVELNNNNTTATAHNHNTTRLHHTKPKTPPPPPKSHLTISTPSYNATTNTNTNRDLGMTKQQQQRPWENLMRMAESDYRSTSFDPDYSAQQLLNLFSYPNLPAPEMDLPTGFIDAWSIHNRNNATAESSSISAGDLSPSLNLSMAMALGNLLDQQMSSIHTTQAAAADDIIEDSIWLEPVGWAPFAGGGPLGEALHVSGGSNPASSYDSLSAPATAVSSPSGVLHRTLFSHSDGGSVCNSPTFSNHWYN